MTGKAKPKKHTAKEIAAKVDAATTNRGGGKAGQADRSGIEKGGHAKLECPHCKITAPDIKTMQIHHDAKHPKIPFDETKLNNLHAVYVAEPSKPRPGVRGSLKKFSLRVRCLQKVKHQLKRSVKFLFTKREVDVIMQNL
ncbi:hypothetical protein HYC85_014155 [Camellia sinensis]|uniref:Uncharacterized protein n=2 Tax=Camellia sinensis TaxID=4442 RepID=A0A7J7H8V8_CAMSI|nr:hypothetical protein HYC85_014155 [Camellia sinensis]